MEVRAGYKQTEVGVIPEDWEICSLEGIADPKRPICYGIVQVGSFARNGIPVLAIKNLNTDYRTNLHQCSPEIEARYPRSRVRPGDLVVSVKGTTGRVGLIPPQFEGNISRDLARIRLSDQNVPEFWFQMLQSETAQRELSLATVGTTRLELSIGILRKVKILRPPVREQRAIATVLSDVDALISAEDRLIAKKRDLKQAAMQQLLTGQTRLPGFHGEWEVKRLGKMGTFLKGTGVKKDEANSGDLPCIRYGEIYTCHNDYIRLFNSWISSKVASTATRLRQGDLLFAGSGETKEEIGKCVAFVDNREAFAGGDIVILRLEGANPIFMGYYCNTVPINAQKASKGQGDAVVHISAAALSSVEVTLPSQDEQSAIATVLSDMDAELSALEARRDKTRDLKQAMMQELLTGRTRLV